MMTFQALGFLALLALGPAGWCYAWRRDRLHLQHIGALRVLARREESGGAPAAFELKAPPEMRALRQELAQLLALCDLQAQEHTATMRQFRSQLHIQTSLQETLRRKIKTDSPLLRELDDYGLLQESCLDTALPQEKLFDLSVILANALAEACGIFPPGRKVRISVVLAPKNPVQWHGHPRLLHALFKHLLLTGLRRTVSGHVKLRVSTESMRHDEHHSMLRIRLSDSGPAVQRWQLRQWLTPRREAGPGKITEAEISWMLVAHLLAKQKGGSSAESSPSGLELAAWLPLRDTAPFCSVEDFWAGKPDATRDTPLIFAVEPDPGVQKELRGLCESVGCHIFIVPDHALALQWLAILPLKAVLLNTSAPDSWVTAMTRIDLQVQQRTVDAVGLGLIADIAPPHSLTLEASGKLRLLRKPLQAEEIGALCKSLPSGHAPFYKQCDDAALKDMSPQLLVKLPAIGIEFAAQVRELLALTAAAGREEPCGRLAEQAHMVKSGALTLGYFRLAALASEIEHSANSEGFTVLPENWLAITTCVAREWAA